MLIASAVRDRLFDEARELLPDPLLAVYPFLDAWVTSTVGAFTELARPSGEFGFARLGDVYPADMRLDVDGAPGPLVFRSLYAWHPSEKRFEYFRRPTTAS